MNLDQKFHIQRLLADRRENMSIMARNLEVPVSTVASTIYGYRANPAIQEAIARYLGQAPEDIFANGGRKAIQK